VGAALLLLLAAIEEAGDQEQHGKHEGELGMRKGVEVELNHPIDRPYGTSDEPDPG
jgi:hypothetical protein